MNLLTSETDELHFMRFAFDHAADAIFWADPDKRLIYVNDAACRHSGYLRDELLNMSVPDILADEPPRFDERWAILEQTHHVQYESLHRQKTGDFIPIEISLNLMQHSTRTFTCGMVRDISERKRVEAKLKRLRAALDVSPDEAFLIDREQMRFIDVNETACIRLGYSRDELLAMGPQDIRPDVVMDEMLQKFDEVIKAHDEIVVIETLHRHKNGTTFPVEIFLRASETNGQTILVESVRDLTRRKKRDIKIESMHRQLVDSAHQAGKAEVATNVLHNVGNVLNSVNVSAKLIQEQVQGSSAIILRKAIGVMEQHVDNLAHYVTQDERGKHLPRFLVDVSQEIASEEKYILDEVNSLVDNINHIKSVIETQQSYAKGVPLGVAERMSLADLLEEAIHVNTASMRRHSVEIDRQFEDVGPVFVDRHKLLQIMVNLISNAKYACMESGNEDHQLTVRLLRTGEDHVSIEVRDNGMGITEENMTRIFAHGFTTRKEGHGFGLHSAAIAAKQLGGTLTAYSDGPGTGATFTLELLYE